MISHCRYMDADVCNDFYHIHISETTVSEMAVSELLS